MTLRTPLLIVPALLAIGALAACASEAPEQAVPAATSDAGHGEIAGAEEVSEPPLALLSIDADGTVGSLDLLSGEASGIGTFGAPTALASDGRYAFATTADGLEIVDSGRWSWDHGDHFHYYLAEPAVIGTVSGSGDATVTTGALSTTGSTGVFFAGSGEAVLLDNAALADGEVEERFRLETGEASGVVAPLEDGALVSIGDELVYHDSVGEPTGAGVACDAPSGAITTRVGLVVGCADGAVLATWEGSAPVFEQIPYPADASVDRALAFDGRKGRPTVSAVAGTQGFWLLDSRELTWQLIETETPLATVVAVDDADGHVVALDTDGRVHVYAAASGEQLAVTDPLVETVGGTESLTVDGQRAYLSDPAAAAVYEIDYADGARIARTLETAADFVTEVGR
jgi:hypothetical protein